MASKNEDLNKGDQVLLMVALGDAFRLLVLSLVYVTDEKLKTEIIDFLNGAHPTAADRMLNSIAKKNREIWTDPPRGE